MLIGYYPFPNIRHYSISLENLLCQQTVQTLLNLLRYQISLQITLPMVLTLAGIVS